MPINANTLGIRPVTPERPTRESEGIQRREDTTISGFRPQTNVALRTAISDLAGTLERIATSEKLGMNKIPSEINQIIRNILEQSLSLQETLGKGIGSTVESQRFSMEQLSAFGRMLHQLGSLSDKGFSMKLSPETQTLLTQFKNLIVATEGGNSLEPVLLSKSAFELLDSKIPEQLPQAVYEILSQLSQPLSMAHSNSQDQDSEIMNFLNKLVKFFMPRPASDNRPAPQPQQQQPMPQQNQGQPQQNFQQPMNPNQPQQNFQQPMNPNQPQQNFQQPMQQNQPQQNFQQPMQQNQPQQNFQQTFNQNQPQQNFQQPMQQNQPQQNFQQPMQQNQPQQNFQQPMNQNQPNQNFQQPMQQNQPQQNFQQTFNQNQPNQNFQQPMQQNQPNQNFQQPMQQNQPNQNFQQPMQQNQPQQNFQQPMQQNQPQQNFQQPMNQNQPQQNFQQPMNQNQPQQNFQQPMNQNQPQQNFQQPMNQNQPQQNFQQPMNQNQPQQNFQQPMNQSQPQQNFQQPMNQNQPQQNFQQPMNQNQPQQNFQQPMNQNQPQQNFQQPMNQNQPQQNFQQPMNQNQPQQNFQQPMNQNQPQQNFQQPMNQNQPQQNFQQPMQQNQPQQNFQQPMNQNQPQQNFQQPMNQNQPQQNFQQPMNQNQPQQNFQQPMQQQQPMTQEQFIAQQQNVRQQMQAARLQLLRQPMENSQRAMETMKGIAQFIMKNTESNARDTALLQNFVNDSQKTLTREEARHLQNLMRLCQQNIPPTVRQAAIQQNLPDLPRLWAFMQLCDMAKLPTQMSGRQFRRAGKDVMDFANSMRKAMSGDNFSSPVQNQRSFQMTVPIYLAFNETSYPTYLNVYDESSPSNDGSPDKKETWVRICILTDHIGAAELIFRVYEENQLDMRFYFSQGETAGVFATYVNDLRDSLEGLELQLGEIRIGSIGATMEQY